MEEKKCEKCKNFNNGEKSCKKGLPLNHKGECKEFEDAIIKTKENEYEKKGRKKGGR